MVSNLEAATLPPVGDLDAAVRQARIVPPGKYVLQIWQESLGTVTKEVTVGDKGVTSVTVEMSGK